MTTAPAPRGTLPPILGCSAVVEFLEGLAALGFALSVGVEAIFGHPQDVATAFGVTVMMLAAGGAMVLVTRGLLRRMPWARSPAVLTQLFALFVAYNLIESRQLLLGVPLAAGAVVALVALLSRATSQALAEDVEDTEPPGEK